MQADAAVPQIAAPGIRVVSDHVFHHRIVQPVHAPQRESAAHPDLLLELTGLRRIDRPVSGVVRARGNFVDDNAAVRQHEHLHGEHADAVQFADHRAGRRNRGVRRGLGNQRRHDGRPKDATGMPVLSRLVRCFLPVLRTGDDHRHLTREVDPAFQDDWYVPQAIPGRR